MLQALPHSPDALVTLPLVDVHLRGQIRTRNGIDEESLRELAASIRMHGVLQPVIVAPRADGGHWLVAGERRVLAASLAGLAEVPAVVRSADPATLATVQAVENLQRQDLHPLDIAEGLEVLAPKYKTARELAAALGKSPAWVSKHRSLSKLAPQLRAMMSEGLTADIELVLDVQQVSKIKTESAQRAYAWLLQEIHDGKATRELVRATLTIEKSRALQATTPDTTEADDDAADGQPEATPAPASKTKAVRATLRLDPADLTTLQEALEGAIRHKMLLTAPARAQALLEKVQAAWDQMMND